MKYLSHDWPVNVHAHDNIYQMSVAAAYKRVQLDGEGVI